MSRRATPGETYWALISTDGHETDSPWVTILGRRWGVTVDPEPHHEYGSVYTSRELATEWQANLPDGTAGKPLGIAQVDYLGGSYFKRHVDDLESPVGEQVTPTATDPRRDIPVAGSDHLLSGTTRGAEQGATMQNQKQAAAEARLCSLLDEGDENKSHSEPTTDQTTALGYVVDLIFPTEDRPNGLNVQARLAAGAPGVP